MPPQFSHRARLPALREIRGTRQDAQPAAAERARVQRGILQCADPDRDIHALFHQVDNPLIAAQFQHDLRIRRGERLHMRHDAMQHKRRRSIYPQPPRRPLTLASD